MPLSLHLKDQPHTIAILALGSESAFWPTTDLCAYSNLGTISSKHNLTKCLTDGTGSKPKHTKQYCHLSVYTQTPHLPGKVSGTTYIIRFAGPALQFTASGVKTISCKYTKT